MKARQSSRSWEWVAGTPHSWERVAGTPHSSGEPEAGGGGRRNTGLPSLLLQSQHRSHFQLHQLFRLVSLTGEKYNIPKPEKTQGLPTRLGKGHLGFAIKRRLGKGGLVGGCVCCDITSSAFTKHQARPCARIAQGWRSKTGRS